MPYVYQIAVVSLYINRSREEAHPTLAPLLAIFGVEEKINVVDIDNFRIDVEKVLRAKSFKM